MADEATALDKAAKILGINLDEQPNYLATAGLNDCRLMTLPNGYKYRIQHRRAENA